jgi:hypothetical protein
MLVELAIGTPLTPVRPLPRRIVSALARSVATVSYGSSK